MKNQIRNEMKEKRRSMKKTAVAEKSRKAAELFLNSDVYKSAKTIMLYMPLGNETNTEEIIKQAFADGKSLVLPVTDEESGAITPVVFEKSTVFQKGGFSIREPQNHVVAEKAEIDVVVVPGIAFDRTGARVGFGKGCYDMFLCGMDVMKVGYCFDFQLMDKIPADQHDIKMDFVVTENEIIGCK